MPQFTMNMDDRLLHAVKLHALKHGTTVSDIIRELLVKELEQGHPNNLEAGMSLYTPRQILIAYSKGRISVDQATARLGLANYSELAIAMADADLELPGTDESTLSHQAAEATKILSNFLKDDRDA